MDKENIEALVKFSIEIYNGLVDEFCQDQCEKERFIKILDALNYKYEIEPKYGNIKLVATLKECRKAIL